MIVVSEATVSRMRRRRLHVQPGQKPFELAVLFEYTAFSAEYATKKAIGLTKGKYGTHRALWMHVTDYSHCQAFADAARAAKIEMIRYASVRDPGHGMNLALLTCRAFAKSQPVDQQTWHIRLSHAGAQAICGAPKYGITFDRKSFAAPPRIAKLRWVRT